MDEVRWQLRWGRRGCGANWVVRPTNRKKVHKIGEKPAGFCAFQEIFLSCGGTAPSERAAVAQSCRRPSLTGATVNDVMGALKEWATCHAVQSA